MSATIIPYLRGYSFDPEITKAMGTAYDRAREMLDDIGQPEVVQEVIAKRIIKVVQTGERDADRICQRAMRVRPLFLNVTMLLPLRRPEDISRYEEGLRKAGLPE